jgi:FkbM family methyltransferase
MQRTKFRGFKLAYEHRESAEAMMRQIDDFPSFFTPQEERPVVIDCGSNIGVSMLEWKTRWPGARIICFEPDPYAFKMLQANVDLNDLADVRCLNAAVSDTDGTLLFYGDISPRGDARGNSIDPAWGKRNETTQVTVVCKRLSPFISDQQVAFLKLDIEGAEQRVLTEIAPHLDQVQAVYVEVHETNASQAYNSAAAIEQILIDAKFTTETASRHGEHALPRHLDSWRRSKGARQSHVLAWR